MARIPQFKPQILLKITSQKHTWSPAKKSKEPNGDLIPSDAVKTPGACKRKTSVKSWLSWRTKSFPLYAVVLSRFGTYVPFYET